MKNISSFNDYAILIFLIFNSLIWSRPISLNLEHEFRCDLCHPNHQWCERIFRRCNRVSVLKAVDKQSCNSVLSFQLVWGVSERCRSCILQFYSTVLVSRNFGYVCGKVRWHHFLRALLLNCRDRCRAAVPSLMGGVYGWGPVTERSPFRFVSLFSL